MTINLTFDLVDLVIFLVIAFIAGSAAVTLFSRRSSGGIFSLLLGAIGAFIGQFIFRALDADLPEVLSRSISLADIVVAFIGAILVLFLVRAVR